MKKKSPNDSLDEAIALLEIKRCQELIQLKEQVQVVHESLKPINIIKNSFKAVMTSPDLKDSIGKTAIGVASGLLVKNILFRKSHNPLKMVAGIVLQTVASGFASKNSDTIKSTSQKLFHAILSKIKHNKNGEPASEMQVSSK